MTSDNTSLYLSRAYFLIFTLVSVLLWSTVFFDNPKQFLWFDFTIEQSAWDQHGGFGIVGSWLDHLYHASRLSRILQLVGQTIWTIHLLILIMWIFPAVLDCSSSCSLNLEEEADEERRSVSKNNIATWSYKRQLVLGAFVPTMAFLPWCFSLLSGCHAFYQGIALGLVGSWSFKADFYIDMMLTIICPVFLAGLFFGIVVLYSHSHKKRKEYVTRGNAFGI